MNPEMKEAERLSEEEQGGNRSSRSRSRSSSFLSSGRVVEAREVAADIVKVRETIEDIVTVRETIKDIVIEAREVATVRNTIEDIVNGNMDTGMFSSEGLSDVVEGNKMVPSNHSDTVEENHVVPTDKVKRKRSETVAGVTGPAVGSSEVMGHLPVELMMGEEESVLRYRSVQVWRRLLGVRLAS